MSLENYFSKFVSCFLILFMIFFFFAREGIYFNSVKANVSLASWMPILFCLRSRGKEIIILNVQSSVNK